MMNRASLLLKNAVPIWRLTEAYKRNLFKKSLRPTDAFLVGHPKSGNTWLAYMLAIILYRDTTNEIHLSNLFHYIPVIHGKDPAINNYDSLPNPRIFRNEWPLYPELYPKTVYILRDPRAVLTSYYHHYRVVTGDTQTSMEEFVREYLVNGCIRRFEPQLIRWDKQVSEWLKRAEKNAVRIVKYEELLKDRRKVLEDIATFLEISPNPNVIAIAVKRGEFKEMRAEEEKYGAESFPGELGLRGRFIRKGTADGWREEMSPKVAELIEREFREIMKKVEYI